MKAGKLFEDALKKADIELHDGNELRVRVRKTRGHLELVVDEFSQYDFESEVLRRSSQLRSPTKAYQPKLSIGERIHSLRKAARLSLNALAEKADISKGSLGSIEKDERSAGLNVLKRIAKALAVDISILID
jgi:DNA-binding XRE family transcriptional regulator